MTDDHASGVRGKFSEFRNGLLHRYGEQVFLSWMADLDLQDVSDNAVTLSTPSLVKLDRLNQQYKPGIQSLWREKVAATQSLRIVHLKNPGLAARTPAPDSAGYAAGCRGPAGHKAAVGRNVAAGRNGVAAGGQAGAYGRAGDRNPASTRFFAESEPASKFGAPGRLQDARLKDESVRNGGPRLEELASPIDPRSTFDAFAVDQSNAIALAAAKRIFDADDAREVVYIYGPSGFGKTHLLHAIANEWTARYPGRAAAYFTHSNMRDGCSSAARSNSLHALHRHIGEQDLVLIDDLHLLRKCVRTQEEILNLTSAFSSNGRQLVIAGEHAPSVLKEEGMNPRLADRLAGGLPGPLERGGYDLRMEVLMKRRAMMQTSCVVADEAVEFIARRFQRSVRVAIGMFNQVLLLYRDKPMTVGVDDARKALKSQLSDLPKDVSLEEAREAAALAFGLTEEEFIGRKQQQRIVRARHAFVLVGRDALEASFPLLGRALKRDHTTIMSAYRRAQALYEREEKFREKVADIKRAVGL